MSGLSASGSQSPKTNIQGQRRSIVDILHDLQRQIQAFGSGPHTPEQTKEIEKLKNLYFKAKQEYEKQVRLLQSMASAGAQSSTMSTINQTIVPSNIQIVNTIPGESVPSISGQTSVTSTSASVASSSGLLAMGSAQNQGQTAGLLQGQNLVTVSGAGIQNIQVVGSIPGVASGTVQSLPGALGTVTSTAQDNSVAIAPTQPRPTVSIGTLGNQVTLQAANLTNQQQPQHVRMAALSAHRPAPAATGGMDSSSQQSSQLLTRKRIQDLLHEIDPRETMDEDVEEVLLQVADDFIENVVNSSCQLAKHRKSTTLEVKDVQLHLDRHWNMWIPGYGSDDLKPPKKLSSTEAHRQRMALIKKSLKK